MRILCGYLIKGDTSRPCVKYHGHKDRNHRDARQLANFKKYKADWLVETNYNQSYYEANREAIRKSQADYHAAHRDEIKRRREGYLAAYRARHPETKGEHRRARRAREAAVEHEPYTRAEVRALTEGICYLCFIDLQPGWHIDHVRPLVLGGPDKLSNVLPACPPCNLAKGSKTLEDYLVGVD